MFDMLSKMFLTLRMSSHVVVYTHVIDLDFTTPCFGMMHPKDQNEVLKERFVTSLRNNIHLCVNIAARYSDSMRDK